MYIYNCVLCNKELFSDAFPVKIDDNGFLVSVLATMKRENAMEISEAMIGGNKSAEQEEEDCCDKQPEGEFFLDVISSSKLQEVPCNKKMLKTYYKQYSKKVLEYLKEEGKSEEEISKFKKNCGECIPQLMQKFGDGENVLIPEDADWDYEDPTTALLVVEWHEDGMSATFHGMLPGLRCEKC